MAPNSTLPATSARAIAALRARKKEVELARDSPLQQVDMGLGDDSGFHDVESVDSGGGTACQGAGGKDRLLLVVAFEADPVTGADDRFEKHLRALWRHNLAGGVAGTCFQAGVSLAPLFFPACHLAAAIERVAANPVAPPYARLRRL